MTQRILKTLGICTTLALILVSGNLLGEKREVNPQDLAAIPVKVESDKPEVIMVAKDIQQYIELYNKQSLKMESKICNLAHKCIAFDKIVVKSMYYKSLSTFDTKMKNGELIVYVNPLVKYWKDKNVELSLSVYHEFGSIVSINQ